MAIKLTVRQKQILDLIRHQLERTGFPPTRAEIARELGFRSANAAEDHLKALAKKGAIALSAGTSRGIRLLSGHNEVQAAQTSTPAPEKSIARASPSHLEDAHSINRFVERLVLPVVGRVAAGSPILATEHVDREITVEPAMFAQTPDYLLKVRGLSMRDAGILDGDLLAVKKAADARTGQIVIARLGDEVTVKRLQREGQRLVLLPENPDFDPIIVTNPEEFTLEGIAVGLIRTMQ